ncbi:Esterase SG1, partial [Pseudolycoriella hygida]
EAKLKMLNLAQTGVYLALLVALVAGCGNLRVNTKSGPVVGVKQETFPNKVPFISYKGIPFAEPPIKELRFKVPKAVKAWTDPLITTDKFQPSCLWTGTNKPSQFQSNQSENCLYLNIYTPVMNKIKTNANMSVLINIHGGGFAEGDVLQFILFSLVLCESLSTQITLLICLHKCSLLNEVSRHEITKEIKPQDFNVDEFINVYNWLFGGNSDRHTKQLAMEMLTVWKIRRLNLTPASVLSTMEILSVQLRDDPSLNAGSTIRELQTMYSNSFTRFLNYMSSIMQGRNMKSMYNTAKELGIESFLVDLRHLCAHGQVVPSIDVFRRSATYCMKWLHDFYWEHGLNNFHDVFAQDVRVKASIDFENQLKSLIKVYDVTCEAMHRKYKIVGDVDGNLDNASYQLLEDYSSKFKRNKLSLILANITNEMTELTNGESRIRGYAQVYSDILCNCKYFFETASKFVNTNDGSGKSSKAVTDFIGLHQNLFRSMAICSIIDTFFKSLIDICENDHESDIRRSGASFWINKIVDGFTLLRDVKKLLKNKKEKDSSNNIDLSLINTNGMSDDLRKIYKKLGVNCDGVLIFGDTTQRPWGVEFENDFITERILKANKYTKEIIEKIRILSKREMVDNQQTLMEWISIYTDEYVKDSDYNSDHCKATEEKSLSFEDDFHINNLIPVGEVKRYGIWCEVDVDVDWTTCPIGQVPWE